METRHFDAFAAVISAGSITAAGQVLGRSQPAVTRLIRELEDELGYLLFERSGPRVTPTARAYLLYEEVERSLTSLHRIRDRARAIAHEDRRPINIAAVPSLSAGLLPAALARVAAQLPPHVHLRSGTDEYVVQAVLERHFDLGLATLPIDHRGLEVHWIGEAPCVAVVAAGSPLASRARLELADLADQRLITMANAFRLRGHINAVLRDHGARYAGLLETNTSVNAILAARAGLGVALVEPATALGAPIEGTVVLPLPVRIPFYFGLITPFGKPHEPVIDALIGALAKTAADTLHGFVEHEGRSHEALLQKLHGNTPADPASPF